MGPSELLMRVTENALGAEGGACVGQSLTALTGLQELHLSGPAVTALCLFLVFSFL
jgi:hypothetical protein